MGFLDHVAERFIRRGYDYYLEDRIFDVEILSPTEYKGRIRGSGDTPYHVHIDAGHPRRSSCDCPYADGKRVICKHQVAMYFAAFPHEAERYYAEVIEVQQRKKDQWQDLRKEVRAYLERLSPDEMQEILQTMVFENDMRMLGFAKRFLRRDLYKEYPDIWDWEYSPETAWMYEDPYDEDFSPDDEDPLL